MHIGKSRSNVLLDNEHSCHAGKRLVIGVEHMAGQRVPLASPASLKCWVSVFRLTLHTGAMKSFKYNIITRNIPTRRSLEFDLSRTIIIITVIIPKACNVSHNVQDSESPVMRS